MPKMRLTDRSGRIPGRGERLWPHEVVWPLVARYTVGAQGIAEVTRVVLEELEAASVEEFSDGRCIEVTAHGVLLGRN